MVISSFASSLSPALCFTRAGRVRPAEEGAGKGEVSRGFPYAEREKGRVMAVEADPENFEVLRKNIEANRLKNVCPSPHC
jgi:tRNA A58 N-methylase Trm61